jgi:hypothetical protein
VLVSSCVLYRVSAVATAFACIVCQRLLPLFQHVTIVNICQFRRRFGSTTMQDFLAEASNLFLRTAITSHLAFEEVARESEQAFEQITALQRPGTAAAAPPAAPAAAAPVAAAASSSRSDSPPLGLKAKAGGHTSTARRPPPVGYTAKRALRSPEPRPQQHLAASSGGAAASSEQPEQQDLGASSSGAAAYSSSGPSAAPGDNLEHAKRPKKQYTEAELLDLRAESDVAAELGLSWPQRGPPPSHGPLWRNQEYRAGSERWANRGGSAKEWYTAFYKAKRTCDKQALDLWLAANPKPSKQ